MEKLRITDVRPETLEELVDYIYTDSSACVDRMARTLLAASELYKVCHFLAISCISGPNG